MVHQAPLHDQLRGAQQGETRREDIGPAAGREGECAGEAENREDERELPGLESEASECAAVPPEIDVEADPGCAENQGADGHGPRPAPAVAEVAGVAIELEGGDHRQRERHPGVEAERKDVANGRQEGDDLRGGPQADGRSEAERGRSPTATSRRSGAKIRAERRAAPRATRGSRRSPSPSRRSWTGAPSHHRRPDRVAERVRKERRQDARATAAREGAAERCGFQYGSATAARRRRGGDGEERRHEQERRQADRDAGRQRDRGREPGQIGKIAARASGRPGREPRRGRRARPTPDARRGRSGRTRRRARPRRGGARRRRGTVRSGRASTARGRTLRTGDTGSTGEERRTTTRTRRPRTPPNDVEMRSSRAQSHMPAAASEQLDRDRQGEPAPQRKQERGERHRKESRPIRCWRRAECRSRSSGRATASDPSFHARRTASVHGRICVTMSFRFGLYGGPWPRTDHGPHEA